MLIWCDVETTGLDPRKDALLEVALVVTDNELNEVAAKSWVLPFVPSPTLDGINEHVVEMHTRNGLWDECARLEEERTAPNGYVRERAFEEMLAFCRKYTEPKSGPLCGSTIAFDRQFLEVHAPDLAAHFSHRNLDVSVFTELSMRMYPEAYAGRPKAAGHRALPDIRVSIELLKYWKSTVLR